MARETDKALLGCSLLQLALWLYAALDLAAFLLCTQFYRNRMLCRPLLLIRSGSMLLLQVVFLGCYGESGKLLNVVAKWPTTSTPPMALSARNKESEAYPTVVAMTLACCAWATSDVWFYTRYGRLAKAAGPASESNAQQHQASVTEMSFGATCN